MTFLIKKLIADKILPNLKGNTCPRCEAGTLSGLVEHGGSYAHRCNNSLCHVRINPHNLHPLSTDGGETSTARLRIQAGMLLLKLLHVPDPAIHIALGVTHNHKATRLRRTSFVSYAFNMLRSTRRKSFLEMVRFGRTSRLKPRMRMIFFFVYSDLYVLCVNT